MLQSIFRREDDGLQVAAEILDTIRSLRVEHASFRIVFTGSIGLHHVLGKLTSSGIPTSPTNDMYNVTVTPLDPEPAQTLAADLLVGEDIECDDIPTAAAMIAEEVGYVPFYIHHVVAGLRVEELSATDANIKDFVARQLAAASDHWELAHFRDRIDPYYPDNNDADVARSILDTLACDEPLAVNDILDTVGDIANRDSLLRLLRLMDADHYLSRDTDGKCRFRFNLIRRWWRLDRGLA